MNRYLLNSAVITAPGSYDYELVTAAQARDWYSNGTATGISGRRRPHPAPISTIGYAETAAALGELLGVEIPVDRRSITMEPGDEALVFRLVFPPGTPRIDPKDKGALGAALVAGHYELGILTRSARLSRNI